MKRLLVLLYGITNYNLGSAALVALIAFIFNLIPANPWLSGIDTGTETSMMTAIGINVGLMVLFALQHSIMARPAFKRVLERVLPAAAERSSYMLATAIVTFSLLLGWQPIPEVIWQAEDTLVYNGLLAIGLAGWALVFYATFIINHFDLFGLRQVWLHFRNVPYTQLPFEKNTLYRNIRHPIMTGVFIGIWFTPVMTVGHLLFAIGMSAYIFIGVYHEEKDLIRAFGAQYKRYIEETGRFLPVVARRSARTDAVESH